MTHHAHHPHHAHHAHHAHDLQDPQRRRWLQAGLATLALGPAVRWAHAATPRQPLVVVMLRGALDGLAAVPPTGDPGWSALRPTTAEAPLSPLSPLPLNADFSLHPSLAGLHSWYREGQLLVVHAVASPYRERSHFDAQQLAESGGQRPFDRDTGWLGRALAQQAGGAGVAGVSLTPSVPLALRGTDNATTWTPSRRATPDADFMARVGALYQGDALLKRRWEQVQGQTMGAATDGEPTADNPSDGRPGTGASFTTLATQAGRFLAEPGGPGVAWLELGGWDTHTAQAQRLQRQLATLDAGLVALRTALGPLWASTTVLVMTEFGRSAALNGSQGTDHGTGAAAFLAGGAVAGGRVLTDWPGLSTAALLDGRDLRPTTDLRALQAALVQRHLGVSDAALQSTVLPGAPRPLASLWRA